MAAFKLKNPRKGTETFQLTRLAEPQQVFQIKESPEGDWNPFVGAGLILEIFQAFKLKNPRKGTETVKSLEVTRAADTFKLKNPRKGTETTFIDSSPLLILAFQIKESPEGDWNFLWRLLRSLLLILSN